ncbi:MAG: glycosyltransferase family 4 protein [Chloroflexaceae bacterium]|jgi:glycosyltransferase involved in cell wall biosynthesis|nr:glycosyltransferase family 4 protein [Chloroflexaceae bacterium]
MKFVYTHEIYPQNGETWIRYEIEALLKRGHQVEVYATWPRTAGGPGVPPVEPPQRVVYSDEVPPLLAGLALGRLQSALPVIRQLLTASSAPRWRMRVLRAVAQASRCVRHFKAFQPDLIVCHFAENRAILGCILAAATSTPYIVIMHAADVWKRPAGLPVFLDTASEVWTISDYNRRYMQERYADLNWERLRVVRVGIKLAEFPFCNGPRQPEQLLCVGRLVPMKGIETLLHACARLRDQNHRFTLTVAGEGPELAALEALRASLQLNEHVRFLGGVASALVVEQLKQAGLFVLAACPAGNGEQLDGIPVALMEAMAMGVPVVSTTVSGIPELVQHGVNGLLVPPNEPAALAEAIASAWHMAPEQRQAMAHRARATIEQHYNVERTVDEIQRAARESSEGKTENQEPRTKNQEPRTSLHTEC